MNWRFAAWASLSNLSSFGIGVTAATAVAARNSRRSTSTSRDGVREGAADDSGRLNMRCISRVAPAEWRLSAHLGRAFTDPEVVLRAPLGCLRELCVNLRHSDA